MTGPSNAGPDATVVRTRAQTMAAYDALPREVRRALAGANYDWDVVKIRTLRRKLKLGAADVVWLIKRWDLEKTAEVRHEETV